MIAALLGSVLSLLFFSAVLAAEIRGGDRRRIRELGVLVGILTLVAVYASHAVIAGNWPQIATASVLLLRGG
ncbi:MAG TPA: hypothetical protein VN668_14070 [Stellaceae bacterium]|nr:hypothetical protein [Stellaceae bacterium]